MFKENFREQKAAFDNWTNTVNKASDVGIAYRVTLAFSG